MSLTKRILLAMALGVAVGIVLNLTISTDAEGRPDAGLGQWLQLFLVDGLFDGIGQIFVKSLQLLVVPLVFVSLVCGSAALGNHTRMGSIALKTILLYMMTTGLAITLALTAGTLIKPGEGIELQADTSFEVSDAPSLKETLVGIFPSNPVAAMAEGNMLQVIVFSLLLGIAISRSGEAARAILDFFQNLNDVVMKMVLLLMQLAPYGVFCLLARLFADLGLGAVLDLAWYFFTVLFVLLLHGLGVYSLLFKFFTRLSPLMFLSKMRAVMVFGFSTASSNATLPVTLRTVENDLGVDNKVASFSVPLGATINMDGTAIMQGVATAFIAQAYGIDIGWTGYLLVVLTATLASVGTAGVPGVGMITLAMVLQQVGLPVEGVALIIGVDRLLDMVRTSVNITGDAMVSSVVANSEGLLDRERFEQR
ncbi:dicarboxylate/amino acid:cation symporter [Marinimicrobium alkaliphilum]|uniref:dicarboxylate/amino acid:cation symporter n=1 Tax=Marinimicrobium alkaliphilum TaxID=2202654 RepID=UPI000DB92005|nr:dicarboxylate/amino acid:cation symporter [Marinimicrobium alkaliphilum]